MSKRIVLLQALASMPNDLKFMLKSVKEPEAHFHPANGGWSIAEVLSHLVDIEGRYQERLLRVVREDHPHLPYILPDEAAYDPEVTLDELASRFAAARSATLEFLQGLTPGEWQRRAWHETEGDTSLRFLVQMLVEHDIEHQNQIIEIKGRLAASYAC